MCACAADPLGQVHVTLALIIPQINLDCSDEGTLFSQRSTKTKYMTVEMMEAEVCLLSAPRF
jgi:hypothetical protein